MVKKVIYLAFKTFAYGVCLAGLLSCASSKDPYEIKSPCVSGKSDNPWYRSPCQKRPVNSNWEIV